MRNVDLFDDYLSDSLSDSERKNFEKRIQIDLDFKNEFEIHKAFVKKIEEASLNKELRKIMDEAHYQEFGKPNIHPINNNKTSYFRIATVAASVSIIIFLSGLLIYLFVFKQKSSNQYEELVNKAVQQINKVKIGLETIRKKEMAPATMEASGFFISTKGFFITSLHGVKNADSIRVQNEKMDFVPAEKVWEEPQLDIAIFKLDTVDGFEINELPISFRKEPLDLGERVFAVGYPRETLVYSEGNISAESGLNGDTTKFQLSMLINPGNSGSPVLDESGNLVGIVSGRNISAQGVSYAVKSKYIYELLENIPDENIRNEMKLDGRNTLRKLKRTDQLKKLKPFVFSIKVYKSED